jgi:hypothetical protein
MAGLLPASATLPVDQVMVATDDLTDKPIVFPGPELALLSVFGETFEAGFPGTIWGRSGTPTWDDTTYSAHGGSYSAWCAASSRAPNSGYPNNMNAWMVYGPFSLADALGAQMTFWFKNSSESGYDYFQWLASVNGANFYGYQISGDQSAWSQQAFDLANVPTLGNLCGQSQVWIAFRFSSGTSITGAGAFVDDVHIQKDTGTPDMAPFLPSAWNDKLPISATQLGGTATHSATGPYYSDQVLYFNWASGNIGTVAASGYTVHVEVTGAGGGTWDWAGASTAPGTYTCLPADQAMGPLAAGTHAIKVWVDYGGAVAESNEGNNYYERTFTVRPAAPLEYYAECDDNPSFTSPANSGWVESTEYAFTSLVPGQTYWYRVKARRDTTESAWSNVESSQQAAAIAGRLVFYNYCVWDGNNPAANVGDDAAIATDKTALLPGGTASFANYTSYSRGINGVMVDIAGLGGTPAAGDFVFKVGNDNSPAGWPSAPAPSSVTLRAGAGTGGSDRVTLIWADNAIQKQWLQVTVLANATSRLAANDVFYFGNAIGETGNSTANAAVNAFDEIGVRAHPRLAGNPADITDTFDINRDRYVNAFDEIQVRANGSLAGTVLQLITPSSGGTSIDFQSELSHLVLRRSGEGGLILEFKGPAGTQVETAPGLKGPWEVLSETDSVLLQNKARQWPLPTNQPARFFRIAP